MVTDFVMKMNNYYTKYALNINIKIQNMSNIKQYIHTKRKILGTTFCEDIQWFGGIFILIFL